MFNLVAKSAVKHSRVAASIPGCSRVATRALSTDESALERKLYEIRTYQLKPEHLMDYLALTGSDAFKLELRHPNATVSLSLKWEMC